MNGSIEQRKSGSTNMECIRSEVDPAHQWNHRMMIHMKTGHLILLLAKNKENGVQLIHILGHKIGIDDVYFGQCFRTGIVSWPEVDIENCPSPIQYDKKFQ